MSTPSPASPRSADSLVPLALKTGASADSGRPVVLVTGAARRLGRAISLHLAANGWDIALHCQSSLHEAQSTANEAAALGARVCVLAADLAEESATRALLPAAVAALGRVDAVVNNASRFEHDDALSVSSASLERHWRPNTAAPVLLAQALAKHLQERAAEAPNRPGALLQGCVVNLLDQKLFNPNPDHFAYTLSKAALLEATRLLAQALAPRVRVVGVAPGLTLGSPDISEERLTQLQAKTPLGYGVNPQDIAEAVAYLLRARSVTGHVLLVDAGSHLAPSGRDFAFQNA